MGRPSSLRIIRPLFSVLGTTFGGDGRNNFELPNLGGIETIGAGQGAGLPFVGLGQTLGQTSYDLTPAQLPPNLGGASAAIDTQQPSLGLNYVINTEGVFPGNGLTLNSIGVVSAFAGNFAPGDELFCDGQLLQISQFSALFQFDRHDLRRRWRHHLRAAGLAGPRHRRRRRRFYAGRAGGERQCDSDQRQFATGLGRAGRHSAARSCDELLYFIVWNISLGGRDGKQ